MSSIITYYRPGDIIYVQAPTGDIVAVQVSLPEPRKKEYTITAANSWQRRLRLQLVGATTGKWSTGAPVNPITCGRKAAELLANAPAGAVPNATNQALIQTLYTRS